MRDIQKLSDGDLMDILSQQTAKLTSLLVEVFKDNEYLQCKELINALTNEIDTRKNSRNHQITTIAGGFFREK